MKLMIIALTMMISYCAYSQTDTLLIEFKDGTVEKIPVSQIRKLTFENITGMEEIRTNTNDSKNYPNPFTEVTTIELEIENFEKVEVVIYDNGGNVIRTLTCENCPPGITQLIWDTKNQKGEPVPSGVYFYEIRTNRKTFTKQMLKLW